MRLTIWYGANEPRSVKSALMVRSVIVPAPWWPTIAVPLIAEMSTALPDECSETLPDVVRKLWPDLRQLIVGWRPESARNSSVASTRRSIWPVAMSLRPAS